MNSKGLIITLTKLQHGTVFDLRDPRLTIRNTTVYLGRKVVHPIKPQSGGTSLIDLLPPLREHIPDCPQYIKVAFFTSKTRKHLAVVIINWSNSGLFKFFNFLTTCFLTGSQPCLFCIVTGLGSGWPRSRGPSPADQEIFLCSKAHLFCVICTLYCDVII